MHIKKFFQRSCFPVLFFTFLVAPTAQAATTPSLGAAASYGILSNTYTNTVPGTTVNGDIGFTTGPAVVPAGVHPNYGAAAPYATAGIDQGNALAALASQPCTFTFAPGAIDLSTDITHGAAGVYLPGVYCSTGAMDIGGPLTLSGTGTYIFRPDGALTSTAGSVVTLAGASVCDVFWTPSSATTLAANTTFVGTIIADAGVTVGANVTWTGRSLAFGGTVTTDTDTISVPTCPLVLPPGSGTTPPLINVRKVPSPLALPAGPGPVTYSYTVTNPGSVTLTDVTLMDDQCSAVTRVSGDINGNNFLESNETWMYTCTMTLAQTTVNYAVARGLGNGMATVDTAIAQVIVGVPVVPPLINIVKTPNPLSLPFIGGSVAYGYVVTNPGTVALTNVTVSDDTCSTVTFASGDSNGDAQLQSTETWGFTCTTNVTSTTVNTAIATGSANGLTAVDTAIATVVVEGLPLPPPLILLLKKASPVILPAGGGVVTFTLTATNPGTVPLSNVSISDPGCGSTTFVSGDVNGNGLMENTETWTYTCQQTVTSTMVNTASASGGANGLTVTSIAVAGVAVSSALIPPAPILPVTGSGAGNGLMAGMFVLGGILLAAAFLLARSQWKRVY
jgi:uncharacterized repeat protein (TIGR01451 family)